MFGFKQASRIQKIDQYLHEEELNRLKGEPHHESQETKVYKALKKAGSRGVYNTDLARICLSWHRRIGDLRKQGLHIQHVRVTNGLHKYYLVEES